MVLEKEYIEYLIESIDNIDRNLIDSYFLDKIDFNSLILVLDTTKYNVMSYKNFVKSKKINKLLEK